MGELWIGDNEVVESRASMANDVEGIGLGSAGACRLTSLYAFSAVIHCVFARVPVETGPLPEDEAVPEGLSAPAGP